MKEGVHTLGDLHKDELYLSFDEMCAQYNLNCKDVWRYMQIKSCVTKVYGVEMHKGTNMIEKLFSSPNIKQTASVCYKMLCKVNSVICDSLRIV